MTDRVSKRERMRARRERLCEAALPWAEEVLLPALGLGGTRPVLESPATGERSLALFVTAGERKFVLRCHPTKAGVVRTVRVVRHVRKRGVPVPEILFVDRSRRTRKRLGGGVTVEEWIEGVPLSDLPDQAVAADLLAAQMAEMHNVYRSRWGNLTFGHFTGYGNELLDRVKSHLRRAEADGCAAVVDRADDILSFLRRELPKLRTFGKYSLCHRAFTPENAIATPDGRLIPIDVKRMRYEHFAANLFLGLTFFGPAGEERFLETYFSRATGRDRSHYLAVEPLFRVITLTKLLHYEHSSRGDSGSERPVARVWRERLVAALDA
jgi:Phosphotransferase enzyme family